jgi:hypothetical protein
MRSQTLIALILCCSFAAGTSPTSADEQIRTPIGTAAAFRLASAAKPSAKPSSCRPSDFAFEQLKSRQGHGHVYIVGRVVNNCDRETGVQIKIAIVNHAGAVLRVSDFWPASTDNIPPHSGWPFQTEMEGDESFDRFQVTIIDVKRWTNPPPPP